MVQVSSCISAFLRDPERLQFVIQPLCHFFSMSPGQDCSRGAHAGDCSGSGRGSAQNTGRFRGRAYRRRHRNLGRAARAISGRRMLLCRLRSSRGAGINAAGRRTNADEEQRALERSYYHHSTGQLHRYAPRPSRTGQSDRLCGRRRRQSPDERALSLPGRLAIFTTLVLLF